LCGHYRVQPRACQPYRAQTKGKIERPFFYLEQQFIKGGSFASVAGSHHQLALFEPTISTCMYTPHSGARD